MSQHTASTNAHDTQRIAPSKSSGISLWALFLYTSIGLLLLLIVGTYLFNWTWTGFRNNTLWDWLQLLVLPVVLTSVTVWFSMHKRWSIVWTWLIILALVALIICMFGGYFLNWTWTGFHNNTLWDWLKLLVLPTVLTAVSIWFSTHMDELSGMRQATNAFRQQSPQTSRSFNQFEQTRDVEFNDSTVRIRRPYPAQHIQPVSAESTRKPVDNLPEM